MLPTQDTTNTVHWEGIDGIINLKLDCGKRMTRMIRMIRVIRMIMGMIMMITMIDK